MKYTKYPTFFLYLFLFVALFFTASQVNAQSQNVYKTCLKSEKCREVDCPGSEGKPNIWPGHTAKLTESTDPKDKKPLPNKETYIVVCLSNPDSPYENERYLCTTGNRTLDSEIYGMVKRGETFIPILDILQTGPNVGVTYKFWGLFDSVGNSSSSKVTSRGDGGIGPLEWSDESHPGRIRQWFALQRYNPEDATEAEGAGHKEATFEWEAAQKDCASIAWDPYGRVFDAETLEPITDTNLVDLWWDANQTGLIPSPQVTPRWKHMVPLLETDGMPLENPQNVDDDGQFSFVVPNNDYILKLKTGYEIEASASAIHPNYSKVYSDLYVPDFVIEQRNQIVHKDIPVKSLRRPYRNVKVYDVIFERVANKIVLSGRVSHPFSKINIETSKIFTATQSPDIRYRVLDGGRADKDGKYRVEIDQALLEVTPQYREVPTGANFESVDLRSLTLNTKPSVLERFASIIKKLLSPKQVEAATVSIPLEPMPSYLEGYARDDQGKVIPNAKVGVYLKFASLPNYETTADINGYFKIASQFIPTSPYDIRYKTPAGVLVGTTSTREFVTQNQRSPAGSQVDLFSVRDSKNNVVPTVATTGTGASPVRNVGTNPRTQSISPASSMQKPQAQVNPAVMQTMVVLMLLILLLAGVGIGVFLYIKNKTPQTGNW